jgi:hypothetical protein
MKSFKKRDPRLVGEVIRYLIDCGELLPNYKFENI